MDLKIRYIDKKLTKMVKTEKGDFIDLRVSKVYSFIDGKMIEKSFPYEYKKEEILFFKLGFAMQMPENKLGKLYARSGTFKNYGFLLTNGTGIIDNSYQGNDDEWCAMVWCTRDGVVGYDERVFQFEVVDRPMENVNFIEVEDLGDNNRGGYSSSGVK